MDDFGFAPAPYRFADPSIGCLAMWLIAITVWLTALTLVVVL